MVKHAVHPVPPTFTIIPRAAGILASWLPYLRMSSLQILLAADGSGLIVPPKTVSNVPPVAESNVLGITVSNVPPVTETNVPPSEATSRSFFGNHDYLCGVKPQQQ